MLSRLKFEISPLVKEMLDQLPSAVWSSSTTTFLDPSMGGGQFLVEIQQRLRDFGHSDENIGSRIYGCEKNKLRVNYAKNNKKLVSKNLHISDFLSYNWGDMKFDVIVGNPPYQDKVGNENSSNSSDLYARFVEKSFELSKDFVMLVIPSAWSGARSSKLKKLVFEEHQPIRFDTHGRKWFSVEMNTCWFVSQKNRQGPTLISDGRDFTIKASLSADSVITTDITSFELVDKIRVLAKDNNLSHRWLRGKLNLNDLTACNQGPVPFVMAVGTKEGLLEIKHIATGIEPTGAGLHKLVVPNVSSSDSIGNIKYATPEMVGGHSVVFLACSNKKETDLLKKYLESNLVKYLVRNIKISTPNSKGLFELIPNMPCKWSSDFDLYSIFGLTQHEISVIEQAMR